MSPEQWAEFAREVAAGLTSLGIGLGLYLLWDRAHAGRHRGRSE